MCGIAGVVVANSVKDPSEYYSNMDKMVASLARRGPDDRGVHILSEDNIALGHSRLSIIDLSQTGFQPMKSASGRFILAFNGEIYNYLELRKEIGGRVQEWRGQSDTEVLVEAIDLWGLEKTLKKIDGMFAISLWDRSKQEMSLVRDRAGEKPLVYARCEDGSYIFASELRAFNHFSSFSKDYDRNALTLYMRHGYTPAPYTVYSAARKVMPGAIVTIRQASNWSPNSTYYWNPNNRFSTSKSTGFPGEYKEAKSHFEKLVTESVKLRLRADVPVGGFLSGGIDSSLIVALMQKESTKKIHTFTIGYTEQEFDESKYAKAVASHIGTDHTELLLRGSDCLNEIENISHIYDEPFADSSLLPTTIVSRLARKTVKVALSGDGGDELFSGYMQYPWLRSLWKAVGWWPKSARRWVFNSIGAIKREHLYTIQRMSKPLLPSRLSDNYGVNRFQKLMYVAAAANLTDAHRRLVSDCSNPEAYILNGEDPGDAFSMNYRMSGQYDVVSLLSYLDTIQYLPDDLLTKLDRASMYNSLECRVPFLDYKIIEFAFGLPVQFKLHRGVGKRIVRDTLFQHVPQELIERPKQGFRVPIGEWLRSALKPWAHEMLSYGRIKDDGVFDAGMVQKTWEQHISGEYNWEHRLWSILMFQSWCSQSES